MAMPRVVPVTMKDREAGLTASLNEPAMMAVCITKAASEPIATTIDETINVGRGQVRFRASTPLKL